MTNSSVHKKQTKKSSVHRRSVLHLSGSEPKYVPDEWNHPDTVEKYNCYDYAFNNKNPAQNKRTQPGVIAKLNTKSDKSPLHQCNILHNRLSVDHPSIYTINYDEPCKHNFYKIGTLVAQRGTPFQRDYHFIRQDDDGHWSHKLGGQSISQLDAQKNLITDPRIANLNYKYYQYKDLCGFYCIPQNSNKKFLRIKTNSKKLTKSSDGSNKKGGGSKKKAVKGKKGRRKVQ